MRLIARSNQAGRPLFAFSYGQPTCASWQRPTVARASFRQQTRNTSCGSPLASAGTFHEILLKENKELRAQLRKTPWPPLTSFEAYGKTFSLPFTSAMPSPAAAPAIPTDSLMGYLAGFFDGDGSCVALNMRAALQVAQTFDRAEILVLLRESFGGGIYRMGNGTGLHKPMLYWRVSNSTVATAASLLIPSSIVKRAQLEIVREWPERSVDREVCTEKLKLLKRYDSSIAVPCTWEYFTGFFDAEGHIELYARCALRLTVGQKSVTVLECMRRFLAQEMGCNPIIRHWQNISVLDITGTSACKSILQNMLAAGLVQKADQARLALSVTPENSLQVRSALGEKTGNQGFGKRRDSAGLERARLIANAQARARAALQKGQQDKAFVAWQDVAVLKADHALQNARLENSHLKGHVQMLRSLQQQGSCVSAKINRVGFSCGFQADSSLSSCARIAVSPPPSRVG